MTPLIGELAKLAFPNLHKLPLTDGSVHGPRVDGIVEATLVKTQEAQDALRALINKAKAGPAAVDFDHALIPKKAWFQRGPSTYAESVAIDDEVYKVCLFVQSA